MSYGGRYARNHQGSHGGKAPKSGGLVVMTTIAVVLVLVLAALVGVMVYKNATKDREIQNPSTVDTSHITLPSQDTEATTEVTTEATTEATTEETTLPYTESGLDIINILVIGNSARKDEVEEAAMMADTMILATVNKNTKTLTLTSFLRDTYALLPAFKTPSGRSRINVCYHLGNQLGGKAMAMQKTNECLEMNFGIKVDYDIEVDFEAFVKIIDILGGITVNLSEDEAKYLNDDDLYVYYHVEPGETWLDGMGALSYARMRHSNAGDSDIKRTERQRALISGILEGLKSVSFNDLMQMANEVLPLITTNMTDEQIKTCLWEILPLLPSLKIESGTCPKEGSYWSKEIMMGDYPAYVLDFDQGANKKYMMAITEGTEP